MCAGARKQYEVYRRMRHESKMITYLAGSFCSWILQSNWNKLFSYEVRPGRNGLHSEVLIIGTQI